MSSGPDSPEVPKDGGQDDSGQDDIAAKVFARESLLTLVVIAFVCTRFWLLTGVETTGSDAVLYAAVARLGVDRGEIPYRDFKVEYPPVAWWLMAAPRVNASQRYTVETLSYTVTWEYIREYVWWFHLELFVADVLCFGMAFLVGRQISRAAEWVFPAAYIAITAAQPYLIYDRLDIVLLLFFLLCVYCWLRSLANSPGSGRWACASYLFLGLGISFKIMPALWAPFFLLADLRATSSVWRMTNRVLLLALGAVGPFLIQMRTAGWSVLYLFQYHSERPIHFESIWGSLMLAARALDVPCEVTHTHNGFNLEGEWEPALKTAAIVSAVASGLALGLWALLRGRRFDRRTALDCAYLALVNSTVLATVFSPQYLNWLVPISLLLAMGILPKRWVAWCVFTSLVLAIVGISSWLYPWHYSGGTGLVDLVPLPVMLSEIRSGCLVALALGLNICFFVRHGLVPSPHAIAPAI